MGYRIEKQKSGKYHVIENVPELGEDRVIMSYDDPDTAKKLKKFLNLGGGFAGFTPGFFLIDTSLVKR